MKGLVVNRSAVELCELLDPVLLSDQHVLLEVLVAGICKTDILVAQGLITGVAGKPFGHEFCARSP
jgi:D-arabinose 1-dehydrogenase-like Zn-dependent alcohol dehydrogenase